MNRYLCYFKVTAMTVFLCLLIVHSGMAQKIGITTPVYSSSIDGDTTLQISAPGFDSVIVHCWHQDSGYGYDDTLGVVDLDGSGNGSILFPADDFPHGPVTIILNAENADTTDRCELQLYNNGGVSWREGLANAPIPPQLPGWDSVFFEDDFDGPMSISPDGSGATYAAHKVGGGDFSWPLGFADPSHPGVPFFQDDGYLRLRADQNAGSAAFISSLRHDLTGIAAAAPCYFECRFIASGAEGTWPAFWLLTMPNSQNTADEWDPIEAYGSDNPKAYNSGFWTTGHTHGYGVEWGLFYQYNPLIDIGGGSNWHQTFHTYGCLITETHIIYYCDNIEIARHGTTPVSKEAALFFMVNLAVGGGWPVDFTRYNGIADMYVDFVRVLKGPEGWSVPTVDVDEPVSLPVKFAAPIVSMEYFTLNGRRVPHIQGKMPITRGLLIRHGVDATGRVHTGKALLNGSASMKSQIK